jgi:hypothetical protein
VESEDADAAGDLMPRIRTIKPEFWQDEKMAAAPIIDRLVFLGLIGLADDCGRLLDNAKVLDAWIFSASDDTCSSSLDRLEHSGRIRRGITESSQKVIQIVNWERHQKIDKPNLKGALPKIKVYNALPSDSPTPPRRLTDKASNHTNDHHTNDLRPTTVVSLADGETTPPHGGWPATLGALFGLAPGRVGKVLKPAVTSYGEARVTLAAEAYQRHLVTLAPEKAAFTGLRDFSERMAYWIGQTTPLSQTPEQLVGVTP